MGTKTGISWTDATWNPIRGCSRVSEGCRHCYAETIAHRFSGPGLAYEGLVQLDAEGKSTGKWNGQIKFLEGHLLDPLTWREPRRIFVNSMSDLFHENVTDEMRDKIFAVMALCPQHTFQVLTKRPEQMLEYFNRPDGDRGKRSKLVTNPAAWLVWHAATAIQAVAKKAIPSRFHWTTFEEVDTVAPWPLPNVHLGVSVEDQKTADLRIPLLLQTPAAVRFISAEPLLGPLDLTLDGLACAPCGRCADGSQVELDTNANGCRRCDGTGKSNEIAIDWVIVGGESGPGARPMHPDWARRLRDQCKAAGVPFFFKQWGEWGAGCINVSTGDQVFRQFADKQHWVSKGDTWVNGGICFDANGWQLKRGGDFDTACYPVTIMHRVGAKASGCLVDGVEHHEFPNQQQELS